MDRISALMDGELGADEARREVAKIKQDATLRERWDEFHLIGDALRGERLLSVRFDEALANRLAAEPTVLAPHRLQSNVKRGATYVMSAAASLGAVALVAWVALAPDSAVAPPGPVAKGPPSPIKTPPIVEASAPLANVPSEGLMNDYLLAHQGFSPSTAIQGLAPYIRSVSMTRPVEGR